MRAGTPLDIGPIHFVGIGGIGMSGIAEVMLNLGYQVHGSDIKANASVERLRERGAVITIGHDAKNVVGAGALVVSTAIRPSNPELAAARQQKIPVVRRAEMLAELMRLKHAVAVAGTHGKTTTTSLVAALLDAADVDPTVINGGVIQAYGSNAKMGAGDWMVVEADESDGSFLKLRGTIAIVTNIDPEHLDHYGGFDDLRAAFDQFVAAIPFYGVAVCCLDHPEVQALVARTTDRRVVTYGFNTHADVRAEAVRTDATGARFDVVISRRSEEPRRVTDVHLPMAGRHNIQNALAAIAVTLEFGADDETLRRGLASFTGVKRRFTTVGSWNGARLIDDYGHHPVEIAAVLGAAREVATGRVIAVAQPHRYTRLRDLFEEFCTCFNQADVVFIADVYAAGEDPIPGFSGADLVAGVAGHGHSHVRPVSADTLAASLKDLSIGDGDVVVCLGAGDITAWAADLEAGLNALA